MKELLAELGHSDEASLSHGAAKGHFSA